MTMVMIIGHPDVLCDIDLYNHGETLKLLQGDSRGPGRVVRLEGGAKNGEKRGKTM